MTVAFDSFAESKLGAFMQSKLDARTEPLCLPYRIYFGDLGIYRGVRRIDTSIFGGDYRPIPTYYPEQWRIVRYDDLNIIGAILASGPIGSNGALLGMPNEIYTDFPNWPYREAPSSRLGLQFGCGLGDDSHWPENP